jgi:hypothetical protein
MLVESKINGKQWLWVNIPKTASTTMMKTFFPEMKYNAQIHNPYNELEQQFGIRDVFTVVRHPVTRFMSGLNHIFSVCECNTCIVEASKSPTTEDVILFLKDVLYLKQNTHNFFQTLYKNNVNTLYLDIVKSFQKIFYKKILIGNVHCVRWTLVMSQNFMLNGANNVKLFKYENIEECFKFINTELGYIVATERFRNYTNKVSNVDVNNSTLRTLIYELHKEDFKLYGYDIC